jgi:metalloendopeptidase OMA1, mitochondrial
MDNRFSFRLIPIVLGLLAIAFLAARGCQEGPFGRKQIINITPEQELQLGKQAYQQVLSQSKVVGDRDELPTSVNRIGERLAVASRHPRIVEAVRIRGDRRFEWEFHVVADPQVNAFCLPGGKVVVNTGIIDVCDTESGLAVVMGHEIGHALARHGVERVSRQQLNQIGLTAAAFSLGDLNPADRQQILGLLGAGARFGLELPFSRDNESEADRIGLLLMAAAGYEPAEAPKFWDRMSRATGGSRQPSFMSTHPSHGERKQQLTEWAAGADVRELYAASSKPSPDPETTRLPRYDPNRVSGSWLRPPMRTVESPKAKAKSEGGSVKFD